MSAALAVVAVVLAGTWGRTRLGLARVTQVSHRAARRRAPSAGDWAELLDAIGADVRAGGSLHAALARCAARAQLHGSVLTPDARLPLADGHLATAVDPDESVAVQALGAAHALGGPVAATLHNAAALLRERATLRAEAQAHSAQARLSARVLTAVPIVFAGWSLASSDEFRGAFLSPIGVACATAGGACNLLGWWWMRRLVGQVA